jgi:hypothetical protein
MNLFSAWRAVVALLCFCCSLCAPMLGEEPVRRAGGPKNLLEEKSEWQPHTGDWQVGGGQATATAGETLAEIGAARAVRLLGRWISLKLNLDGDSAKAGLVISGIQDAKGETLRLTVERASGNLTNGRGKTLASLGDIQPPLDLLLRFEPEKLSIFRAGNAVTDFPITYSEPEATLSLFAERGTVSFNELLLAGEPQATAGNAPATPMPATAAPAVAQAVNPPPPLNRPRRGAAAAPGVRVALDVVAAGGALKSGWNEYFGVHVETAPGPWKMVRQFDGPSFGFPAKDRHTGDVKTYDGPFAKQPVLVSLADMRDWKRKDARALDENLKTLVENDRAALFIAPWATPIGAAQQDHVWAAMKLIYGANVGAEGRIFFQWGDDINHRRLGVVSNARSTGFEPRGGASAPRGSNAPADAVAYVENYFAPAVEATRKASEEIFRDPQHIPIILGSCARASIPENRDWYRRVLEHEITGATAPSLKGRKVITLVDYLTVNYPFVIDSTPLQELWAGYGNKVKGLWVTEEQGVTGRGVAAFLEKLALYLDWVAANQLTADQSRLFWNFPVKDRDSQNLGELARRLGTIFGGAPLTIAKNADVNRTLYRISAGDSRVLFVHVPVMEKRGRRGTTIAELAFEPPQALAARSWEARFILAKERKGDANGIVLPIDRKDGKLVIAVDATSLDTWGILLTAADPASPPL